jgi:undecaprenyl pyrophosphate synthase
LLAGILNLYVFYDHLNVRPKREMDAEKSELMKELEQEAKRRKQRDQFQQN